MIMINGKSEGSSGISFGAPAPLVPGRRISITQRSGALPGIVVAWADFGSSASTTLNPSRINRSLRQSRPGLSSTASRIFIAALERFTHSMFV